MVSLSIQTPKKGRVYRLGDMIDPKFRFDMRGKIYTKQGSKFTLHPINKEFKK